MKNIQKRTQDDISAVLSSVEQLRADNRLNGTPRPFKSRLALVTKWALLLSAGFILFWLLIGCAPRRPVPGKGNQEIRHERKHRDPFWHQADTTRTPFRYEFEEWAHCEDKKV